MEDKPTKIMSVNGDGDEVVLSPRPKYNIGADILEPSPKMLHWSYWIISN